MWQCHVWQVTWFPSTVTWQYCWANLMLWTFTKVQVIINVMCNSNMWREFAVLWCMCLAWAESSMIEDHLIRRHCQGCLKVTALAQFIWVITLPYFHSTNGNKADLLQLPFLQTWFSPSQISLYFQSLDTYGRFVHKEKYIISIKSSKHELNWISS